MIKMGMRKGQTNSGSIKKGERRSKSTEIKKGQRLSKKTEFGNKKPWNKGLKGEFYKKHYKNEDLKYQCLAMIDYKN